MHLHALVAKLIEIHHREVVCAFSEEDRSVVRVAAVADESDVFLLGLGAHAHDETHVEHSGMLFGQSDRAQVAVEFGRAHEMTGGEKAAETTQNGDVVGELEIDGLEERLGGVVEPCSLLVAEEGSAPPEEDSHEEKRSGQHQVGGCPAPQACSECIPGGAHRCCSMGIGI